MKIRVVADAKGQALKWQGIIVLERDKVLNFVKVGGNTDIFVP